MSAPTLTSPGPVGERLRRRRQRAGLTIRELAEQAKVSRSYVSLIERGERWPSLTVLRDLHLALDAHIDVKAEAAEAQAEIQAAAEMLAEYIGREPEQCTDADDDADIALMIYPADVAALLARIGTGVRGFEALSGPFTYDTTEVAR